MVGVETTSAIGLIPPRFKAVHFWTQPYRNASDRIMLGMVEGSSSYGFAVFEHVAKVIQQV
ncbi:TPA: hypothetical protein MH565_14605 [Klebsiella pneumoniae]|nr:hypothetical protein [Klebsiella pneumoniae]HBX2766707.1 hypothetical protein [Klebsiella pneumoniae]HBX5862957.1 hypothetical protein [Klebsiella pneumoniae]HBX5891527.1 hypothetical protein [Klebsiella pneumoniae]HBX5929175.1 hypothetical protein [Klebsiella pneumoniae]